MWWCETKQKPIKFSSFETNLEDLVNPFSLEIYICFLLLHFQRDRVDVGGDDKERERVRGDVPCHLFRGRPSDFLTNHI